MTDGQLVLRLVLLAIVGLGIGIWLGMPGRDRQSVEDIERAMDEGTGRRSRSRTKRKINPLAWLRRKADPPPSRSRGSSRGGFRLESPDDRE